MNTGSLAMKLGMESSGAVLWRFTIFRSILSAIASFKRIYFSHKRESHAISNFYYLTKTSSWNAIAQTELRHSSELHDLSKHAEKVMVLKTHKPQCNGQ